MIYDAAVDCVYVEYNGTTLPALWPYGYGWTADDSGVQSPDGQHVARIGDMVRLVAVRSSHFTVTIHGPGVTTAPPINQSCVPDGDALAIFAIA